MTLQILVILVFCLHVFQMLHIFMGCLEKVLGCTNFRIRFTILRVLFLWAVLIKFKDVPYARKLKVKGHLWLSAILKAFYKVQIVLFSQQINILTKFAWLSLINSMIAFSLTV